MDISKKLLLGAAASGRVSNAYLFIGAEESALLDEAISFSRVLNCGSPDEKPCGACPACSKIGRGVHPDVLLLKPSGKSIKIDEIRQISEYARFGPAESKWKIVIVPQADTMTEEASNSFLKTLEEPVSGILFILTTTRPAHVIKTVSSRCQSVQFSDERSPSDELTRELTETFINIDKMDIPDLLAFSDELANMPDPEETLNSVLYAFREKVDHGSPRKLLLVKEIFKAVRSLERKANKRLALDSMFLSLKEASQN